MVLIVGLGNPGKKYENTRHNVGFMGVEAALKKLGGVEESVWGEDPRFKCLLARVKERESGRVKGEEIILIKPQTFMNASGTSVAKVLNFYKISPLALYVIHDEIDLPLGKVKIVVNRGAAGHHGVESIIKEVGTTNFVRIRVGIGLENNRGGKREMSREVGNNRSENGEMVGAVRVVRGLWDKVRRRSAENFVLEPFHKGEGGKLNDAIKRTVDIMETILEEGVERAMTKFN